MRWLWISGGVGLAVLAACSESNAGDAPSETPGTGGFVASGGTDAATGGTTTSASGGKPGAGGASVSDTGGAASTGGASGASTGGVTGGTPPTTSGGAGPEQAGAGGNGSAGAPLDSPDVTVRLERTHQLIEGFGVSNIFRNEMTDADAKQLFDVESGWGLTILRVLVTSSGAPEFNLGQEVELALAHGAKTFVGVAWSADPNCKTNYDLHDGGFLEERCYEEWSDALAAFPAKFKAATGVDLYGLSPQNEPDFASCGVNSVEPSCYGSYPTMLYTPEQLVEFVKVLGPKIRALEPPVLLMGPETREWNRLWTNYSPEDATDPHAGNYDYGHALYADPTAWGFLDVIATHQYDTQRAEPWPSDVPQEKPVWMTEMAGLEYWPEGEETASIQNGVVNASWIHDGLVNGNASAWLFYAHRTFQKNNMGLLLLDGTIPKRAYTLGNFSRFIRPGFERVSVTGEVPEGLLLSAYRGPGERLVVVAINRSDSNIQVPIVVSGGAAYRSVTPILTSATDNLAERQAVSLEGGSFLAALPGQSVTTFVGTAE